MLTATRGRVRSWFVLFTFCTHLLADPPLVLTIISERNTPHLTPFTLHNTAQHSFLAQSAQGIPGNELTTLHGEGLSRGFVFSARATVPV